MSKRVPYAIFLGILLVSLPALAWGLTVSPDKILEKANGHRFPDPVTVQGYAIPTVTGGVLENYRVFSCREGKFEAIRFQIDEMTEGGDFVFPYGSKSNKKLSTGVLAPRDLVLFMAHDAGDRVAEAGWPEDANKGIEIEVVDPVDQTRSWVYLLFFEKNPPPLCPLPDYTTYEGETETLGGEYWKARYVVKKKKCTNVYREFMVLPKGGGNGENFVDRLKIRAKAKLFFGKITINYNEEKFESYAIDCWIQGPIRVVRRLEHIIKGPFRMTLVRILSDIYYYETMFTCPIHFTFPFKIENVLTSLTLRLGMDYAPMVKGSMFYNSENPQGVMINGKMDESEENFNPKADKWRVMVGDWGAVMTRSVLTTEAEEYLQVTIGVTDDETYENPPETYPGNVGWTWQDWRVGRLPGGHYTFYLEFYTPPFYKPGGEVPYLNYLDYPLKVKVSGEEHDSQIRVFGVPGKGF